mmetsp:Transcript_57655/g.103013  ORF Transcript_57655/g.103013 Transcript_57655/m.103013 type:complete len:89 (-) Transcript_57655:132-398(-)
MDDCPEQLINAAREITDEQHQVLGELIGLPRCQFLQKPGLAGKPVVAARLNQLAYDTYVGSGQWMTVQSSSSTQQEKSLMSSTKYWES